MIGKELLSEVLGYPKTIESNVTYKLSITEVGQMDNNKLYFHTDSFGMGINSINIYELAHKCKEWATHLSPNKQALSSYPRWGNLRDYQSTNGEYYVCQHLASGIQFEAETEPESIFKACQWILENKDK